MKEIEHVLRHYKSPKDPKTTSSDSTKDSYACSYINSELSNVNSELSNVNSELSNVNSKFNYSTDEQVIGTWIDGKPLYKQTIYISSLPNRTATDYNHNISNIDEVYGIEGVLKGVYEGNYYFEPIVNMNAGNISATACGISVSRTAITILSQNTDRSSNSAFITIRYTKTTDSIPQNNTRTTKKRSVKK